MDTGHSKAMMRAAAKAARGALSPAQRRCFDTAIARAIEHAGLLNAAAGVVGYRSRGSEASVDGLLETLIAAGRRVYLPRVAAGGELELCRALSLREGQRPGAFGILEPEGDAEEDLGGIDAILIPGVSFDTRGIRLGHGLGYYDRLLRKLGAKALRIGIAYEAQIVPEAPADPWDEPVDWIVTETGARQRVSGPGR
ncbi:MAG TPA: 5-formyltetrahydrofolate cyclo-ligase [Armatimonadota bacterium]|nr:5-formyltetrahydrofolate cyclo-ligase [Armatimonadota bacterium]